MARSINKLTAREVASLKKPGRHSDGGGLYLRVTTTGSRSWVFMVSEAGKRQEIGLGSVTAVPLAAARRLAAELREANASGRDLRSVLLPPVTEQIAVPTVPTFGTFADSYITSVEDGWKNPVHRQQWRNSLRDHARALFEIPVDAVSTDNVMDVLLPIWLEKAETAKRVRGRIEKVLDAAKARGHRSKESTNPAAWRGHLALLLPKQNKLQRGHHAALRFKDAPAFMAELSGRSALAARCLEFVILTAARSGEALGATWGEIDLVTQLWTVPATRMKAGVEHIVPLSPAAVRLLLALRPDEIVEHTRIFAIAGAARSNMAMAMLLRRMGRSDITVHGFRSTFRDWAGDATNFPREIVESAMAHTIQNKSEKAYRRGTAVEWRRELMATWSVYLQTGEVPGKHRPPNSYE